MPTWMDTVDWGGGTPSSDLSQSVRAQAQIINQNLRAREQADKQAADAAKQKASDWDRYADAMQKAYESAQGFERDKLKMQYEDAKKNRDNAWKIAQYQADKQAQTAKERLAFDSRKWDDERDLQTWALSGYMADGSPTLDRDKFGLDRDKFADSQQQWRSTLGLDAAKTAASLAQNPLNWFEAGAFYDEAARNGYLGDAASMLRTTLNSGGGSVITPQTNNLSHVVNTLAARQGDQITYDPSIPRAIAPAQPRMAFDAQGGGVASLAPLPTVASGAYSIPTAVSGQPTSINAERQAFADEAVGLAQTANQWDPQQWQSYSPTKQALLKSAWKSRGLNPDDVLFKAGVTGISNEGYGQEA